MGLTLESLDREWVMLSTSEPAMRALKRWGAESPMLAVETFEELLARRWDPHVARPLLRALAERAAADRVAARTLLQALVPGLGALARRFAAQDSEVSAELITLAWERIRTYPLQRPGPVAGNVLLDVRKTYLAARALDRRSHGELGEVAGIAPSAEDVVLERDDHDRVITQVADARRSGAVNEVALRAIVRTRLDGESLEAVAAAEDLSVRNLVLRRWRGERALRQHFDLARTG